MSEAARQFTDAPTLAIVPPVATAPVAELLPLVGESRWHQDILAQLDTLASSDQAVSFLGPSGTGKTLLAQWLHWRSASAPYSWQVIDLGKIPPEIVESELFGYTKGGFLTRRTIVEGRIAQVGSGSCLLLGMDRLPATVQERCLPWLLERRYIPTGSDEAIISRARILFEFPWADVPRTRETALIPPLYEYVTAQCVMAAPLSERRDDILPIAQHYLERYAHDWGRPTPSLSAETERFLRRALWRDNVRSVLTAVAAALHETQEAILEPRHFPPTLARQATTATELGLESTSLEEIVEQKLEQFFSRLGTYDISALHEAIVSKVERPLIRLVLKKTRGNQVRAARMLGINRNTLRTRIRQLGIAIPKERE